MSRREFPTSTPRCLGQFWLPGTADTQITGVLEVEGSRIRLEVSPELTPWYVYQPMGNGVLAAKHAPETGDTVVLGELSASPVCVSLWQVMTVGRHAVGMPIPGARRPGNQSMEALWCIAGGHVTDPESKWFGVRPDVTNLSEWASLSSVTETIFYGPRRHRRWDLDLPDGLDELLPDGQGYIMLDPAATISPTTIRGFDVTTRSELEVELLGGWTLADSFERLALPLADLMTLLSGTRCSLRSLNVWSGHWCSVYGHHVQPDAPESVGELLLRRNEAGLGFVSRWLALHRTVTPVAQIVAAATSGEFQTVEAEALSLVTAVEGFHRALEPDARRFSVEQIDDSLRALGDSEVPLPVRESLESALRQYWHEDTYPKRVRKLAEPVAAVVPECVGRIGRWKNAVVEQRISLAHGKRPVLDDDQALAMISLNRSLRWVLTLRLLLLAGIDADILAAAVQRSERFRSDSNRWRQQWPSIYQ